MSKPAIQALSSGERTVHWPLQAAIVISASLFVALCAHLTLPLPFTPVPLTLENFAVLLMGLSLGSRRGFAALALYLAEGLAGFPVFTPTGPGGLAQLLGPTGGFLLAYPFVAGLAGYIMERGHKSLARAAAASVLAEVLLFAGGLSWLAVLTHSFTQALRFGLYWFVFAEVIKIMLAASITTGWKHSRDGIMSTSGTTSASPVERPPTEELKDSGSSSSSLQAREITIAHSPDSDDAFMFYALATHKVRSPGLFFTHTLCDIETLNRKATEAGGLYDVTAISFHAYPYIQENYALLPSGGSLGEGYGPMIVAVLPYSQSEIKGKRIAVPGTLTTAYLALQLFAPGIETEVVPFDQIIPQVLEGKYEAGLIIHEGQLTYSKSGLQRVVDLGKWWYKVTGLPLPLGGNAIRRSLGPQLMTQVATALRESIQYALDHRDEALAYALQFSRDLDPQLADKFVGMYVNERTLDYGLDGREAIRRLLDMGHKAGIIPYEARVDFV